MSEQSWLNLEKVSVLALEQSAYGMKILAQILRGFGIREIHVPKTVGEATAIASRFPLNLIIADPGFDDGKGQEFLRWLRRADQNQNRFVPIILSLGHSTPASVKLARDTGANFVVAKPYPPKTLLDRILWVARDKRPYVEVGDYVGPDRRFKSDGPPKNVKGRRENDPASAPVQAEENAA
ncbi:MAG: response regulator [Hyphomonadaceae bacterium]|nr:response regulator [Hyphomonadaceae bacterium]